MEQQVPRALAARCGMTRFLKIEAKCHFRHFRQNLVKPLRRGFLEYVIDSMGEINVAKVTVLPFAG
jgi:hypothetical protein